MIKRLRLMIPKRTRQRIASVLAYPATARLVSDRRSFSALRRLENFTTQWPAGTEPVELRVRPLNGETLAVRPETADRFILRDTFLVAPHLPSRSIAAVPLGVIVDLGSHIGMTIADFAVRYPTARLIGVELDAANAALCRRNIAPWASRCVLEEAGIWSHDGYVGYRQGSTNVAARVTAIEKDTQRPALSLTTLLDRHLREHENVDFMKMDIEGAEREVLRHNTGWATRVQAMRVEVHGPYTTTECLRDLDALGFIGRLLPHDKGPRKPVIEAIRAG